MLLAATAISILMALAPAPAEPDLVYVGTYNVTAYSYTEGGGENYYTAGGYEPEPWYTVAATEEFDLGTILYIEDVGEVQVQDRGAFPEGVIDLHVGYMDPEEWGVQKKDVYIVAGGEQ